MAFDYAALLRLDNVRDHNIRAIQSGAFYPDGQIQITYDEIPLGAGAGCVDWLYANRTVLEDVEIGVTELKGPYRTVSVQEQTVEDKQGTQQGVQLVQTLAKGYYTAINWNAVRVAGGAKGHGNSQTVPGVSRAGSETYGRTYTLIAPYIDPKYIKRAIGDITRQSYTDLVVARNTRLGGTWDVMSVGHKLEEDNTCTAVIVLGQTTYTLAGYSNAGTHDEMARYYVTSVPQQYAASVLSSWKSNKGADGHVQGVNTQTNTVNMILSLQRELSWSDKVRGFTEECFRKVTQTVSRSANRLTHPGFTQGKIVRVDSEQTLLGNYLNKKTEDEAKADVQETWSLQNDVFEGVEVSQKLNSTVPLYEGDEEDDLTEDDLLPSSEMEDGVFEAIVAQRNKYCYWDNRTERRIAKEVEDSVVSERETLFEYVLSDTIRNRPEEEADSDTDRAVSIYDESGELSTSDQFIQSRRLEKTQYPQRVNDTFEQRVPRSVEEARLQERETLFEKTTDDLWRNRLASDAENDTERAEGDATGDDEIDYVIDRVRTKSEYPNTVDDRQTMRKFYEVEESELDEYSDAFVYRYRDTWKNRPRTEAEADLERLPGGAGYSSVSNSFEYDDGVFRRVLRRLEAKGIVDDVLTKEVPKEQDWEYTLSEDSFIKRTVTQFRNKPDGLVPSHDGDAVGTKTLDKRSEATRQRNKFYLWDGRVVTTAQSDDWATREFSTYSRPFRMRDGILRTRRGFKVYVDSSAKAKEAYIDGRSVLDTGDLDVVPIYESVPTSGWYRWKKTHRITLVNGFAAAVSAVNEGDDGSSYNHVGGNQYLVDKISSELEETSSPF